MIRYYGTSKYVLFHILTKYLIFSDVIINDINTELINTYKTIKDDSHFLINQLQHLEQMYCSLTPEDQKQFFLSKRDEYNLSYVPIAHKSALLIFLNKTCFNGLYRVNSKNEFNVSFGQYKNPKICDKQNILEVSDRLEKVTILNGDFERTLEYVNEKTLFYIDPPYKPISETSSFKEYSQHGFYDIDQIRVKNFCDKITENGHFFILSNSSHEWFREIYQGYNIQEVLARRNVNSKGDRRGEVKEFLITNF